MQQTFKQRYLDHWWVYAIPLCILLLIQILPIPYWLIGFITGGLVVYFLCKNLHFLSLLCDDPFECTSPKRTSFCLNWKLEGSKTEGWNIKSMNQSEVFYPFQNEHKIR